VRARELGGADVAARPALVVDHELLAEGAAELVADQAAHRVGAAARREGHDEAHGLGRPLRLASAANPRATSGAAREEASRRRLSIRFPRCGLSSISPMT
jgi:hypothetical protein